MTAAQKTDRREFLKKGLSLGLVAGGAVVFGKTDFLLAKEPLQGIPDIVAVKNGEPDALFKKAISLMGGMGQFVKKGQSVVIKPNMSFASKPELAATTNPLLVKTIVEHCFQAGAKKVYVFDNVLMYYSADKCYKLSGIADAAKNAGATIVPADDSKYFKDVNITGAKKLTSTKVHELVLKSDVLINVPVLKNHGSTQLSIAMKNLMGLVWNRMPYHMYGLDQSIADFCLYRKPDLNIVDAYRVILRGGPRPPSESEAAKDIELKRTLLMSRDIVAIDSAATKIFGSRPEDIEYIKIGNDMKIGNMNLNQLKIVTHAL